MLFGLLGASGSSLRCTKCGSKYQAQAAAGTYGCTRKYSGRGGKVGQCEGTYIVKRSQAEAVMENFQLEQLKQRNADMKAAERAAKEARRAQQQSSVDPRYMKPLPSTPPPLNPKLQPNFVLNLARQLLWWRLTLLRYAVVTLRNEHYLLRQLVWSGIILPTAVEIDMALNKPFKRWPLTNLGTMQLLPRKLWFRLSASLGITPEKFEQSNKRCLRPQLLLGMVMWSRLNFV